MELPSPENKKSYYDLFKKLSGLCVQKQEDFLEQCCEEIMKLHDADHQSKAVWRAINLISGNSVSKGIMREKLWYNHFNNLFSPPSSTESNAADEELPTGIH
jgi:hypothetical protein